MQNESLGSTMDNRLLNGLFSSDLKSVLTLLTKWTRCKLLKDAEAGEIETLPKKFINSLKKLELKLNVMSDWGNEQKRENVFKCKDKNLIVMRGQSQV